MNKPSLTCTLDPILRSDVIVEMAVVPPREKILAVAGELFHKRGYAAVEMEEIAQAVGFPKAVLYEHFSTKRELGKAWLGRLHRKMAIFHREFLERSGDGAKRLRKYFFAMRTWVEANGFRSCQFANTAGCIDMQAEEDLALLIDKYKRDQLEFFIQMAKGLVDESQARRVGTTIFLLYSGAMTECQNLKSDWPLEDALAQAERLCGIKE